MDNITIGQIYTLLLYVIGLGGAVITITKSVKTAVNKAFAPINKQITEVDLNATKNFLVARIDEISKGQKLDGVAKERFYEEFEHYKKLGGNSYIQKAIESLEREKLL